MHGDEEVNYRHPDLAKYFGDTYGIPVYQEQLYVHRHGHGWIHSLSG